MPQCATCLPSAHGLEAVGLKGFSPVGQPRGKADQFPLLADWRGWEPLLAGLRDGQSAPDDERQPKAQLATLSASSVRLKICSGEPSAGIESSRFRRR